MARPSILGSGVEANVRTSQGMRTVRLNGRGDLILPADVPLEYEVAYFTLMDDVEHCRLKAIHDAWTVLRKSNRNRWNQCVERRDLKKALPKSFQGAADTIFAARQRRSRALSEYLIGYHTDGAGSPVWDDPLAQEPNSAFDTTKMEHRIQKRYAGQTTAVSFLKRTIRLSRHAEHGFGSDIGIQTAYRMGYISYGNQGLNRYDDAHGQSQKTMLVRSVVPFRRPKGAGAPIQKVWKHELRMDHALASQWYTNVYRKGLALIDGHFVMTVGRNTIAHGDTAPIMLLAGRDYEPDPIDTSVWAEGGMYPLRFEWATLDNGHLRWPDGTLSTPYRAPDPTERLRREMPTTLREKRARENAETDA